MRQWLVKTSVLCRKHLLGEHVESHMMVGYMKHGNSIRGFLVDRLYDPTLLYVRHDALAVEMKKRGYRHQSNMELLDVDLPKGDVDVLGNYIELVKRCPICAAKIAEVDLTPYIKHEHDGLRFAEGFH